MFSINCRFLSQDANGFPKYHFIDYTSVVYWLCLKPLFSWCIRLWFCLGTRLAHYVPELIVYSLFILNKIPSLSPGLLKTKKIVDFFMFKNRIRIFF